MLKDLFYPMVFPKKFYNYNFADKSIKHVFYHVCGIYLLIVILSLIFGAFMNKNILTVSEHIMMLFGYIIVWISISLISPLPLSIFVRMHLPKDLKETFEKDRWLGMKWANKQYINITKVVGYSMAPLIIFTHLSLIFSEYFFYLSWLWILLGMIGISEVLKITKIEALISLFFSYILASFLFLEPLMQII
jgi:hypothetical protein